MLADLWQLDPREPYGWSQTDQLEDTGAREEETESEGKACVHESGALEETA